MFFSVLRSFNQKIASETSFTSAKIQKDPVKELQQAVE
jgi:hypothetical protein